MFDLAAAARSEILLCNRAWGRGSPGATGEGGQRPWSAAGAGRTRAAQGGCRLLAGVGEGFPVVLSEMATAAGNALGAHPGRGKPGLHRSRFRLLWVGGRSLLCSRGSPIWLGTRREPGRAGTKPGGAGQGGGPFAAGVGSWQGWGSIQKYFLSVYYMLGTTLGVRDTEGKKTQKITILHRLT